MTDHMCDTGCYTSNGVRVHSDGTKETDVKAVRARLAGCQCRGGLHRMCHPSRRGTWEA